MNESNQSSATKTKKRSLRLFAWISGVLFIFYGLVLLFSSPLSALASLIAGGLLLPPSVALVKRKLNISLSRSTRIIGAVILLAIVGTTTSSNQNNLASDPKGNAVHQNTIVSNQPAAPKTEEQKIADLANADIQQTPGASGNMVYTGVDIRNDDSSRPAGSKYYVINFDVGDFLNKSSLLRETGNLSSNVFQSVFPENPHIYDVIIWYNATTTDLYGKQIHQAVLTYTMDLGKFKKMNWSNIDTGNLCDTLNQLKVANGDDPANPDTSCNTLVNIN